MTTAFARGVDVIRMGFEPMTHSLEGCCSIQLSYPTILTGAKLANFFNMASMWVTKSFERNFS